MAKAKKKSELLAHGFAENGLRSMRNAPDQELIALLESGEVSEEMVGELPQNHPVRTRLIQLQKQIKKDLSGQTGLKEFRGNIMGALRWAAFFEWGVSKIDAMKQAMAISDRAKDAQIIMQARTAGEQILRLVQGGQAPQVQAPAREAQKQGMAIGGGGAPRQDLATLIAAAKKQMAEKAAKAEQAKKSDPKAAATAAPSMKNVPVDPKAQAAEAQKAKQAQEAEQQDKQKAGG